MLEFSLNESKQTAAGSLSLKARADLVSTSIQLPLNDLYNTCYVPIYKLPYTLYFISFSIIRFTLYSEPMYTRYSVCICYTLALGPYLPDTSDERYEPLA